MIEIDPALMRQAMAALTHIPEGGPKALARAINRAAETARTEASRKIREMYYIKHSDIRSTISIRKATASSIAAEVVSRGRPVALTKFRVTPRTVQPRRNSPVIVRVKRGGGGAVAGAFVARVSSGHVGVFRRLGQSRLPIQQLYGPSVPQMLGSPDVVRSVEQKAQEALEQRLNHEINRLLGGGG